MSVGGKIIGKKSSTTDGDQSVIIYTVEDSGDTTSVMAKPSDNEPGVGDTIWWQGHKIYWDNDRQVLEKVGFSF